MPRNDDGLHSVMRTSSAEPNTTARTGMGCERRHGAGLLRHRGLLRADAVITDAEHLLARAPKCRLRAIRHAGIRHNDLSEYREPGSDDQPRQRRHPRLERLDLGARRHRDHVQHHRARSRVGYKFSLYVQPRWSPGRERIHRLGVKRRSELAPGLQLRKSGYRYLRHFALFRRLQQLHGCHQRDRPLPEHAVHVAPHRPNPVHVVLLYQRVPGKHCLAPRPSDVLRPQR